MPGARAVGCVLGAMTTPIPPRDASSDRNNHGVRSGVLPERVVDLLALLALLGVAAGVYMAAGPTGFSVVVSAGGGLFATWRATRR